MGLHYLLSRATGGPRVGHAWSKRKQPMDIGTGKQDIGTGKANRSLDWVNSLVQMDSKSLILNRWPSVLFHKGKKSI